MANSRRLFRTNMLDALGTFFPAVCTVQSATLARDAYGQPLETWVDVADLTDLRGQLAPATEDKLRQFGLTLERTTHILHLQGHYPAITPDMRVQVAGDTEDTSYTIRGVRHDSHGLHTYLGLSRTVASTGDA